MPRGSPIPSITSRGCQLLLLHGAGHHRQERDAGDRRPGDGPNPSLHRKVRPSDPGKPVQSCSGQPGREQSARGGILVASSVRLEDATLLVEVPRGRTQRMGVETLYFCVSGRNSWIHADGVQVPIAARCSAGAGHHRRSPPRHTRGLPLTNGDAVEQGHTFGSDAWFRSGCCALQAWGSGVR